ncbi:MAG: hypothetical protein JRI25_08070 [Deltaproteobacteria bacterium]|nr:hypothetical protein [Deltaproteobacteria bacterium]
MWERVFGGLGDRFRSQWAGVKERASVAFEVDLDEELEVQLAGRIPVRTRFAKVLEVAVKKKLRTVAAIDHTLDIPLDETLDVPIDFTLHIPLDTDVHIKDTLTVESEMELDTTVTAMGVAPIPIRAKVPIYLEVPIDQTLHIRGEIEVPIRKELTVRVKKTFRAPISAELPVLVMLDERLPVELDVEIDAAVEIAEKLPIRLQKKLRLTGKNVRVVDGSGRGE